MKYRLIALVLLAILTFQCKQKEVKGEFSFTKKKEQKHLKGEEVYTQKCTACHKVGSTFIGPPPNGILKRRTPEWVMNMILNPEIMLQKDSLAKALFMEFNGQLMTNQQVTVSEARAMLEYFRTLDR
jgi:hypothetical protein